MIIPTDSNNIENNKIVTIQYTKEELDKMQSDFLQQLSKYFAKVNKSNGKNEVEQFPPPPIIERQEEEVSK